MNLKFWRVTTLVCTATLFINSLVWASESPGSSAWVAVDARGRELEPAKTDLRTNRTVGIFYFVWQGAHGYDRSRKSPDEGVLLPLPSDTESPYDVTKILDANPSNPVWGPVGSFHYWSEPRFGYYVADDEWVIRKHGQMLSDIGVDVLIIDATNACIYMPQVNKICQTFTQMRKEGSRTPQITFIVNSKPEQTVQRLYKEFYAKGDHKDLWFFWKGKPLLMTPPEGVTSQIADFFTVRHSWFSSKVGKWFGDGKDKWTWADHSQQSYGWHESPYVAEQISVATATHPTSNIGRSYHNNKQPDPKDCDSGAGYFLKEQTDHALRIDPEFVFVTGWNEWVAQRFIDGRAKMLLGKEIHKGDTYFVDQYSKEFSRDIEPMKGGHEDSYYYQLAQFIRDYKGGQTVEESKSVKNMAVDGKFDEWQGIYPTYSDNAGDTFHRNHHGWGSVPRYVNTSGRNDIIKTSVAVSGDKIHFYVETNKPLSSYKSNDWMKLFVKVDGQSQGWEGYQYALNIKKAKSKTMTLSASTGGWHWQDVASVPYRLTENKIELSIPLADLGLLANQRFVLDFKWVDNGGDKGDILMWQDNGDAAPNARFCYRYKYVPTTDVAVVQLRCQGEVAPLEIEYSEPCLSWRMVSTEYNIKQIAFQIEIADSRQALMEGKANVWQSGRQQSDRQIGVAVKGAELKSAKQYFWRVKVWSQNGESSWSEPSYFGMGLLNNSDWSAEWITRVWGETHTMPYFRKQFSLSEQRPVRATAYLCGLGCSQLYINGKRVGDRFLDPAQTNYEDYALYSAIDITDYILAGGNTVGVLLGDGWYNQDRVWGLAIGRYGDPMLRMQMVLEYADGSTKSVITDRTWEWHESPVLSANIYAGESYDAREEIPTWCTNSDKTLGWQTAVAAKNVPPRMMAQIMAPMRPQQAIKPIKISKNKEGNWILDFGINIVGFPRITVEQPRGTLLKMRMSEAIYPDRTLDLRSTGVHVTHVVQTDEYICKGGKKEYWQPSFTYHGFRFLELSGFVGTPSAETIEAVIMHSDVERIGTFACSDEQINHLHTLAVRTMSSNMHGIPTDCPVRERCGWTGDAHAEQHMANFNFGMENFWIKYLHDMRSSAAQVLPRALYHKFANTVFDYAPKPSGLFYMVCPGRRACGVASPDWGTAFIQLPWYVYQYYGNEQVLAEFYPDMKVWVDYNSTLLNNYGLIHDGLGDWCPPGGKEYIDCPVVFSSSAFHYLDLSIMERTAVMLGKGDHASNFAKRKDSLKSAIIAKLYDAQKKSYGSQTANAMAIDIGLVPDVDYKAVSNAIVEDMNIKRHGFMHTGIFGLARLGNALSDHGNQEQAWKVFTKRGEHSFAQMWEKYGATSLWEVLPVDSTSHANALSKSSQNHSMQGGYDAWFYRSVAGIAPSEDGAGYKKIEFNPAVIDYADWAKATIETPYGEAMSSWRKESKHIVWKIKIPVNSSGEVFVPKDRRVTVNGQLIDKNLYPLKRTTDEKSVYLFGSGDYIVEY